MGTIKKYIIILQTIFLLITGCIDVPEEIILPEWDVELNLPLTNKTYTIYDMYKPESKYSVTSTISSDDFYLIQSDNFTSNSKVADYISFIEEGVVSESFIVPANTPEQSVFIVFPESIEIDNATFASGFLAFNIQNPSPSSISSALRIPGIKKPDGSELIIQTNVAAFSRDSVTYDLSNHQYVFPSNQSLQNKNSLQLVASASSSFIGAYENVDFYLYGFNLNSVTGSLPRTELGSRRTSASLNLNDAADYRGKLFIKEGTLTLKSDYVSSHGNFFELEISNILINGIRNSGEQKSLTRKDGQGLSFRLLNGAYELTLNESNSNLNEFISFLPDSIVISSEYILNPSNNNTVRTITSQDSIKFSVQFSTKSIFAIKQVYFTDTLDINLSQDDRDKIKNGLNANLSVNLENAIPIDAYLKAILTDESYQPLFTITKNQDGSDSLQFLGGQVNISTGEIVAPTNTLNAITLNNDEILKLLDARYVIISATVNTKNANDGGLTPPTVQFKSSDWLKIKSFGRVKYRINTEDK